MPAWIRFQFEAGETSLINAEQSYIVFKPDEQRIEVYATGAQSQAENSAPPICLYLCETANQVSAAEELIFDQLAKSQSITINLDVLDDYDVYLHNVHGLRMVLQLIHHGRIRIPMENDFDEQDLFDLDNDEKRSEIGQFEETLHNFLEVPDDALRKAFRKDGGDLPFELATDHEECVDHGFHEYWVVKTRPDRHYSFRDGYSELVRVVAEKEGYEMDSQKIS